MLSAYVKPSADRYLSKLKQSLEASEFGGQLYIMQSNCGVDTVDATRETPIKMVESGPASGVWGAAELGRLLGEPNVLALDIGGTTAKCSLVEGGHVTIISDYWIERDRESAGYPILVPVVDLVEIGNGGGSIAWVDHLGRLHVGPRSAGADPGPVAYAKGGTEPTTTDANLALGRINADYFCGGAITADMAAVNGALEKLAGVLNVSREEAARGIVRIANHNMINALKLVSLNRGYDPRDFTLVAFGGGGGMHASALAAELQIEKVIIPAESAVFAAWGMVMSDLRRDYFRTFLCDLDEDAPALLRDAFGLMERQALAQFDGEGFDTGGVSFIRFARFRYRNQEHSAEVLLPDEGVTSRNLTRSQGMLRDQLRARIHLPSRYGRRSGRPPPRRTGRGRQARARREACPGQRPRVSREGPPAWSISTSTAGTRRLFMTAPCWNPAWPSRVPPSSRRPATRSSSVPAMTPPSTSLRKRDSCMSDRDNGGGRMAVRGRRTRRERSVTPGSTIPSRSRSSRTRCRRSATRCSSPCARRR